MPYLPQPDSLAMRLCTYFLKHPEEELSAADMALKFDVTANNVATKLADAMAHKLIERVRNGGVGWSYRAGANLQNLPTAELVAVATPPQPRPAFPSSPFANANNAAKQRRTRVPLPVLNAATLHIETDIPLPTSRSGVRTTDWRVLLERLATPGLCSCPLPVEIRNSLKNAADKWFKAHGGTFAIRAVSRTHIRIWRTA